MSVDVSVHGPTVRITHPGSFIKTAKGLNTKNDSMETLAKGETAIELTTDAGTIILAPNGRGLSRNDSGKIPVASLIVMGLKVCCEPSLWHWGLDNICNRCGSKIEYTFEMPIIENHSSGWRLWMPEDTFIDRVSVGMPKGDALTNILRAADLYKFIKTYFCDDEGKY